MERKIDEYSYHLGAADCFCEMVRAGVKKIALSHPCDTKEMRDSFLLDFDRLCDKYSVQYYVEDAVIITDLFPVSANKDKFQVVFYREEQDLNAYLALKDEKEKALKEGRYEMVRTEIAQAWGRLLSYPAEGIERLIKNNTEKEQF